LATAALAMPGVTAVTAALSGCTHAPVAHRDARRLRVLETAFHETVSSPLSSTDDIESHIARLEALRLEYLDALSSTSHERDRLLALLRLAELHLDASARIRRVPYPRVSPGSTMAASKSSPPTSSAFDKQLSARALPLEATGLSLLEQIVQRGDDAGVDGRFVRRARLYLRLHTDARLEEEDIAVLRAELVATTYRAPRSLLDTGRIGQRAARR